jgi:AI-2 transport protein TqsA
LIFLMAEKLTFDRRMTLAFGDTHAGRIAQLAQSINEAIINYIAVKTWISLVTALMSLGVFLIFGVEFAFFWALLIFLLNFIPYLGGLVAMGPPVALAFLQHDTIWPGVLIIVALTGIQLFTGQVLEPRVAGKRLNLSPLLILLSLAFWGYLWNVPGMLLAVPLTVVIKIVLDHIPETRPIATLMSNL